MFSLRKPHLLLILNESSSDFSSFVNLGTISHSKAHRLCFPNTSLCAYRSITIEHLFIQIFVLIITKFTNEFVLFVSLQTVQRQATTVREKFESSSWFYFLVISKVGGVGHVVGFLPSMK